MDDLWPEEIGYTTIKAPVTILREQAALLGGKTKNLVTASVLQYTFEDNNFAANFYLKAPALGRYQYKLFSIQNDSRLYPVTFILDDELRSEATEAISKKVFANNEDEFLENLKTHF